MVAATIPASQQSHGGDTGGMVAISLFVELLRTRPRVLLWTMTVAQVALWTLVPALFYSAPPGQLPVTLAIGHEFLLGTEFGPPLAFWLAEIAFRVGGMFGVYLLSQLCIVATYWTLFSLGRVIVGEIHAVMAVMLMAGIAVFSLPSPEFGPGILAAPLWALILLHYWRATQQDFWISWLGLGFGVGLLLLTTFAGLIFVALLLVHMVSTSAGRAKFADVGPWIAGVVVIAVIFPYLAWLDLSGGGIVLPDGGAIVGNMHRWGQLAATLLVGHIGLLILVAIAGGFFSRPAGPVPTVLRPQVDAAARWFVYFFALAPIVAMGLFALMTRRPENFIGAPLVVMSGLAVVVAAGDRIRLEHQYLIGTVWSALLVVPPLLVAVAVIVQPWTVALDLQIGRPAAAMGPFFADNFYRRTGEPLSIVAGDLATASLVALMAPSRPSLFLPSAADRLQGVSRKELEQKGAMVVWPVTDLSGKPPPDIERLFPQLAPEVPRGFERRFSGRMSLARVGWGMIRPHALAAGAAPEPGTAPAAQ